MANGRRKTLSRTSPLLQALRRALRRGELTAEGYCAVEGVHLVEEALGSGLELAALVASRSAEAALARLEGRGNGRVPSYLVSDRVFRSLTETETPQGIAALVRLPTHRLDDCLESQKAPLVAALVGLQDPGNLGTILRTLEAFGGRVCLLAPNTVSPFNAKAVRASAGSLFRLPVFRNLAVEEIIRQCRRHRVRTVGLAAHEGRDLRELDLRPATAFFIGQEAGGLPPESLARLDAVARIELAAPVESLNAAIAAAIAFYEAARQRRGQA
ncbi:MAG: RNA methyltransferase [Acidobacteria bacterium]|nr:RNA methyltransferase [Acidobacteriota bacterium]